MTQVEEFHTPSRNLGCRLDDTASGDQALVGCLVEEHDFADPTRQPGCEGDLVPVVWLGTEDVVRYGYCSGDPFAVPQTVLPYGSATAVGDFACLSEASGVTCWNVRSKHGFVVSRDSYQVF